jgi:hypothetical protein
MVFFYWIVCRFIKQFTNIFTKVMKNIHLFRTACLVAFSACFSKINFVYVSDFIRRLTEYAVILNEIERKIQEDDFNVRNAESNILFVFKAGSLRNNLHNRLIPLMARNNIAVTVPHYINQQKAYDI